MVNTMNGYTPEGMPCTEILDMAHHQESATGREIPLTTEPFLLGFLLQILAMEQEFSLESASVRGSDIVDHSQDNRSLLRSGS